jgi:hypothetical protein
MDLEKLDPPTQAVVLAYYTATAPLIAAAIGRVPFKPIYCPDGLAATSCVDISSSRSM